MMTLAICQNGAKLSLLVYICYYLHTYTQTKHIALFSWEKMGLIPSLVTYLAEAESPVYVFYNTFYVFSVFQAADVALQLEDE